MFRSNSVDFLFYFILLRREINSKESDFYFIFMNMEIVTNFKAIKLG